MKCIPSLFLFPSYGCLELAPGDTSLAAERVAITKMRVPDVADVQTRPTHRVKMVGTAGARVRRRWASWQRRPGSLTLCDGLIWP